MRGEGGENGDVVGMILCAGLGTRLRPLTSRVPKPAIPVCGVPLIRWNVALLASAGIRRAVVNVHHLADAMARAAQDAGREAGVDVAISREPVIAGTGGALREARGLLAGAGLAVVVNGDILFDVDLPAAISAHRVSGALATMVLMPMPPRATYAAVETDPSGAVRRIAGRFGPGGRDLAPWHFTGVHVISGALLDGVPREPFELDVNRHVYPAAMESGAIRGWVTSGYWSDLGTPERYLAASADVLAGGLSRARFRGLDPFSGLESLGEPGVWVGRGTHVEVGAALHAPVRLGSRVRVEAGASVGPFAVVGDDAVLAAGSRAERAVLWSGTSLAPGEEVVRMIAAGEDRVPAGGSVSE